MGHTPLTPIVFDTAREVRALLVDQWGMTNMKFTFVYDQVIDTGYCPFIINGINYCLTVTKDRSEWRMIDVTEPPHDPALDDPAYDAWAETQLARGVMAFHPETMECHSDQCGGALRKVTRLGPVVGKADPTQTYELECGHTVI